MPVEPSDVRGRECCGGNLYHLVCDLLGCSFITFEHQFPKCYQVQGTLEEIHLFME